MAKSKIEKTEGIVIKCKDYTETSQLVWLFTKKYGKLKVVAKGSRKRSKKYQSKLDLFSLNEIIFYQSVRSDLHTLSEVDIIEPFTAIRTDVEKMAVASYVMELLNNSVGVEDPDEKIYFLILSMFTWLAEAQNIWFIQVVFEIKLLKYAGTFLMPDNISKGSKALIKKILDAQNIKNLKKLRITPTQKKELENSMRLVVDYSVGKRLKSLDFIAELKKIS